MLNWISTSDPSRKPEVGKPVFIRGEARSSGVYHVIAMFCPDCSSTKTSNSWSWSPSGIEFGYDGCWDSETVTHWAEIPEGLFNEPTA